MRIKVLKTHDLTVFWYFMFHDPDERGYGEGVTGLFEHLIGQVMVMPEKKVVRMIK